MAAINPKHSKKAPLKEWGFFVYIAGDNDLSDAGLEDISELCEVGASPTVHVGVEIDTFGEHTGSVRYEISEPDWTGAAHRVVIQRLGEKNSGDPATLTSFAQWALNRYPTRRRLMVVWNHGSGFRSPKRDIAFDDFGDSLDMPEVERALNRAGIGSSYEFGRLAVLGFDACLMNMVEIVHHFADTADLVVGSQQTEPGDGWPYNRVLERLRENPSAENLARAIVDDYIADYRAQGIEDVTQSAVVTARASSVIDALAALGVSLSVLLQAAGGKSTIRKARINCQTYAYADYVDLGHLAKLLADGSKDQAVSSVCGKLLKQVKAAVISSKTYGKSVAKSSGLSVWFPPDAATYYAHRAKYLRLKCNAGGSSWVNFLDNYFG